MKKIFNTKELIALVILLIGISVFIMFMFIHMPPPNEVRLWDQLENAREQKIVGKTIKEFKNKSSELDIIYTDGTNQVIREYDHGLSVTTSK